MIQNRGAQKLVYVDAGKGSSTRYSSHFEDYRTCADELLSAANARITKHVPYQNKLYTWYYIIPLTICGYIGEPVAPVAQK